MISFNPETYQTIVIAMILAEDSLRQLQFCGSPDWTDEDDEALEALRKAMKKMGINTIIERNSQETCNAKNDH